MDSMAVLKLSNDVLQVELCGSLGTLDASAADSLTFLCTWLCMAPSHHSNNTY